MSQIEANVRFENIKRESKRFDGAEVLSEKIWELGKDYEDELIKLLKQLLSKVSWQEALARACVELLEGEWARQYQITSYFGDENPLWPSQIQGIAQAIWVIENVGSVLIADATGSGKTRMGAHLIKSVINQIWATGRKRKGSPVLICPPDAVQEGWDQEFNNCDFNLKTYSYGILRTKKSNKYEQLKEAICRSQVLAVDEAHKFLNRRSQQTQGLFNNMADYVILFTATPINRGSQDLLAIIELLGADNFDDELLEILKPLWKQGNLEQKMLPGMRQKLRMAIQHFTVRRTKSMLNQMIDENPERYQDRFGKLCRYPQHESKTYTCGEIQNDRSLAKQIRELTQELRGLVMLQTAFEVSEYLGGVSDKDYLNMRLKSAPRLSSYNVMSCLRSSKAALLEHISGTESARKYLKLADKVKEKETGNIIQTLDSIAGKLPQNKLKIELPDWLSDRDTHERECEREIRIYENIADLTKKISYSREETKAKHLQELLKRHKLLIAFDSHIITLSDIKNRIDKLGRGCQEVIIATGVNKTERKHINELFKLGSTASRVIALCSDAMSEGVNLQQASAVVLLDMPSVIRLAEQRIGRVDRLDSPHNIIEAWWPKDSDEFALRSSEQKLGKRHRLVSDLLGSNFPLPKDLAEEEDDDLPLPEDLSEDDEVVIPETEITQLEKLAKNPKPYELGDVFDPVRSLVENNQIEKNNFLVSRKVYEEVRNAKPLGTWVSCVTANYPWAFFAVAGTEWGAPRWVYLDHLEAEEVITDMERISEKLRKNLLASVKDIPIEDATQCLEGFLEKLKLSERQLLPNKKQRALKEMEKVLQEYHHRADQEGKEAVVAEINVLTDWIKTVDLSKLAEWWLDLIRPRWYERLKQPRRSRPLRLQDIRKDLIDEPISMEQLREAFKIPKIKPLDERIVAAIIGVY